MGEYAVFATKSLLVARHRSHMIDVTVLGSRPFQVVNLRDSLLPHEALAETLGVAHRRGASIRLMTNQVVADTVQVVGC